ncbi:hypothetical protein D3C85_917170 [compost metagenome]
MGESFAQYRQTLVQAALLAFEILQAGVPDKRACLTALGLPLPVTSLQPQPPDQQRHHDHSNAGRDTHGPLDQRLMALPHPVRAQPPDTDQRDHHTQHHQDRHAHLKSALSAGGRGPDCFPEIQHTLTHPLNPLPVPGQRDGSVHFRQKVSVDAVTAGAVRVDPDL